MANEKNRGRVGCTRSQAVDASFFTAALVSKKHASDYRGGLYETPTGQAKNSVREQT